MCLYNRHFLFKRFTHAPYFITFALFEIHSFLSPYVNISVRPFYKQHKERLLESLKIL